MPIYEFRCECGHEFEIQRPIRKRPKVARCPLCGKASDRPVWSFSAPRRRTPETAEPAEHDGRPTEPYNATITDSVFAHNRVGILGGGRIKSRRNRFIDNETAVINRGGFFDDEGSQFE